MCEKCGLRNLSEGQVSDLREKLEDQMTDCIKERCKEANALGVCPGGVIGAHCDAMIATISFWNFRTNRERLVAMVRFAELLDTMMNEGVGSELHDVVDNPSMN